jgi:hypothetical protein
VLLQPVVRQLLAVLLQPAVLLVVLRLRVVDLPSR